MPMAIGVNLVIMEKSGKTAQTGIWVLSSTTLANAQFAARRFAQLIEPLHEGATIRASIVLPVALTGVTLRATPLDNSSLGEGAQFAYRSGSNFKTSFRLPCINEVIYNADRSVDLLNTDVLALNSDMVGGLDLTAVGGTGTVQPTVMSDEDITALRFVTENNYTPRR